MKLTKNPKLWFLAAVCLFLGGWEAIAILDGENGLMTISWHVQGMRGSSAGDAIIIGGIITLALWLFLHFLRDQRTKL